MNIQQTPNVFVNGACLFPQNASKNPTGPVGCMAFFVVDLTISGFTPLGGLRSHALKWEQFHEGAAHGALQPINLMEML